MNKTILAIIITILLLVLAVPIRALAVEDSSPQSRYTEELDDILADSGVDFLSSDTEDMSFGGFVQMIRDRLGDNSCRPFRLLGTLLMVTVLSSLLKSTGSGLFKSSAEIYGVLCVLTTVTIIAPQLFEVFGQAVRAVEVSGGFISVFIPVFTGVTAASGRLSTAAAYDVAVLAASELIVQLASSTLMPVLSAASMLSVTGATFPRSDMSGVVALLKKVITWGLTIAMTVFIGFVTLKCTLAGKADGAASKAARFVISGSVPIVGGAVSDAYATVRGSFDLIRGTVGVTGCIAVALIILPPVLQVMLFRFVMWIGSAAAELFGEEQMKRLLSALDSALAIAQCVLVCYGLMFVLSTGIIIQTAGG